MAGGNKKKGAKHKQPIPGKQRIGPGTSSAHRGDLEQELAALGLRCKRISADGNCFFRALSDQLQGDEQLHASLREQVVEFMASHADMFAPFVEDDESLDTYLARMRREGVWAGQMELQAASLLLGRNMHIYQAGQPRWTMQNLGPDAPQLHLSYHDGEHYNSVRLCDDFTAGPALPIVVGASTAAAAAAKASALFGERELAQVTANTGCDSLATITKALDNARGNVDAATELVIEWMAARDGEAPGEAPPARGSAEASPSSLPAALVAHAAAAQDGADGSAAAAAAGAASSSGAITDCGTWGGSPEPQAGSARDDLGGCDVGDQQSEPSDPSGAATGHSTAKGKPARKKLSGRAPSRNKACACGSGKKYKSCCGVATAAAERRRAALQATQPADAELAAQVVTLTI